MTLNGITPSFGKTHINSSKMNATQKELSENIIEQTKNTDEFKIKIMLIYTFFQKAKNL